MIYVCSHINRYYDYKPFLPAKIHNFYETAKCFWEIERRTTQERRKATSYNL